MDERQKRIRYYTMPQNDTRKECRVASAQELIETVRLTVYNAVHMQVLEAHHEMARVRPDRAQRQWDWVAFGVAPLRGPTVDEFKHEKDHIRRRIVDHFVQGHAVWMCNALERSNLRLDGVQRTLRWPALGAAAQARSLRKPSRLLQRRLLEHLECKLLAGLGREVDLSERALAQAL